MYIWNKNPSLHGKVGSYYKNYEDNNIIVNEIFNDTCNNFAVAILLCNTHITFTIKVISL